MFSSAGNNIGSAVVTLADHSPQLINLIEKTDFSAQNISSMLHGAGNNIRPAIVALVDNLPKLINLTRAMDKRFVVYLA